MDSEEKNQIKELKNELDHAKKAFNKWNSLIQKREELECQIEKMQAERYRKPNNAKLLDQQLSDLTNRLRKLDTLLDHLEEHSPEKIEMLENQLIDRILTLHPEQRIRYEQLQQALEQAELQMDNFQHLHKSLNNIIKLLKGALEARHRVKCRGILSYIFGANPNQVISQHLHAIAEQIGLILPWLNEAELSAFLIELQQECKQRWGFQKIDLFFGQVSESLIVFIKKIEEQIKATEGSLTSLKREMDEWMMGEEKGEG